MKHRDLKRLDRFLPIPVAMVILLCVTIPAMAAPEPSAEPTDLNMGVMDAMEYAVVTDPSVKLAGEARSASFGAVSQNMGIFDPSLGFQFSYDGGRQYLNSSQYHGETQKRLLFRLLAVNLQRVADDLFDQLGGEDFVWADCGRGLDLTLPGGQPVCLSGRTQAIFELYHDLAEASDLEEIAQGMVDANLSAAANSIDDFNAIAASLRGGLRNIGTVPTLNSSLTTAFDLRLTKLFRNGIILEPGILLDGFQDNYVGKPFSGALGGKGVPDAIRSVVGITLDIPLGKGRGKVSTAASENAARQSADAFLADEAFAITASVESTALAYWDLAAFQTYLELQRETEAIQAELLEIGEALVKADEYAKADLHFVRGRLELTRGRVASAEEDVLRARIGLADVMGQSLTTVDEAPIAADGLPGVPDEALAASLVVKDLFDTAVLRRFDLAAARSRREAAETIAKGAAFDIKRRVDFQMALGYAGLHEGGDTSKFGDLTTGWWEALSDFSSGPSFRLGLTFELPFGNRVARGLSLQAHSLQQKSRINLRDLERSIANEIERLTGSLEQAIQEAHRRLYSVERYRESLASDIELYKSGEGKSIDVLLTQEALVAEETLLISARRAIAFLATQLSFETGRLVDCRIGDEEVTVMAFYPVGDVASLAAVPSSGGGGGEDGSQ